MSVTGISSSSFFADNPQNRIQQFRQEFQQLGQDLQAGNMAAAQSDFTQLQQLGPHPGTVSTTSSGPIAQAFNQLSQNLQAGNLTRAQHDFTSLQQDFQKAAAQGHHHHHHHGGGGQANSASQGNSLLQAFTQLGQALQSGSLATAQQAYLAIQDDLQQFVGGWVGMPALASGTVNATA